MDFFKNIILFLFLENYQSFGKIQTSRGDFNSRRRAAPAPQAQPIDTASLHPSWQAKKQMEDKLKSLKFEGKKLKFDD